jgi:hypothetical protein
VQRHITLGPDEVGPGADRHGRQNQAAAPTSAGA